LVLILDLALDFCLVLVLDLVFGLNLILDFVLDLDLVFGFGVGLGFGFGIGFGFGLCMSVLLLIYVAQHYGLVCGDQNGVLTFFRPFDNRTFRISLVEEMRKRNASNDRLMVCSTSSPIL
jgi:hypothetical protein